MSALPTQNSTKKPAQPGYVSRQDRQIPGQDSQARTGLPGQLEQLKQDNHYGLDSQDKETRIGQPNKLVKTEQPGQNRRRDSFHPFL
jgi:hypothetical protein